MTRATNLRIEMTRLPRARRKDRALALLLAAAVVGPRAAWAEEPAAPSVEQAEERIRKAEALNQQGVALLEAGSTERALEAFVESRRVLPTTKNVTNAAICLDELGRYDESLELLEELLIEELAAGLDEEDRAALGPMMADLRAKVGSVSVSSNAGGEITIDGRPRGKLPLRTPLRVLAGSHKIRIARNGFHTFEKTFEVAAGGALSIDAKLEPILGVGQLVVTDEGASGTDLYVDGAKVGTTPWEGSLAPGEHLVWTENAEVGTAPMLAVVVEGQAALVTLKSRPLGARIALTVEPREAAIELGGTRVGKGQWSGRLPLGAHPVSITEPGYHAKELELESASGAGTTDLTVRLDIDESHPRWPKAVEGDFWVGAFGGFSGASSFGSTPDQSCPEACEGSPTVLGFLAGLRGAYRFPFGASVELAGGYWRLGSSFTRTLVDRQETTVDGQPRNLDVTYQLEDDTLVHGPFVGAGVSYRGFVDDVERFHLLGRATIGVLIARATNPIEGTASTSNGETVPIILEERSQVQTSVAPFIMPEIGAGAALGPIELVLSLGIGIFPANGPTFERGRFGADTTGGSDDPLSVKNSRESGLITTERAYSSFLLWVPQVAVQHTF